MRLIVKYLLPCFAMFYMPFINSVKFIFATKEMSYESGRCKGVVLPQKERSRCQRELSRNGKVECRQVLRDGIQCENVGTMENLKSIDPLLYSKLTHQKNIRFK